MKQIPRLFSLNKKSLCCKVIDLERTLTEKNPQTKLYIINDGGQEEFSLSQQKKKN